uniref:Alcohol dehydrogenase-like C-terminal domain-containing protein n=1 Tax=Arion vulgaris TaxID=1028688 RepID=A0A0B7BL39_9EUPU
MSFSLHIKYICLPYFKNCINSQVLTKSARVSGFFLPHYRADFPRHIGTLIKLYKEGKLKVSSDVGVGAANGPFVGLEKVADAVEHMYARKNVGKVIVELNKDDKSAL